MSYNPDRHHRRSIRLRDYDYTQAGAYFITTCIQNRECLLGSIVEGDMVLNDNGKIVENYWQAIPEHSANAQLDAWVVMPNHIHGIIVLNEPVGALLAATQSPDMLFPVGALLAAPKSFSVPMYPVPQSKKGAASSVLKGAASSVLKGAASSAPTQDNVLGNLGASIGKIMRRFKSTSAIAINRHSNRNGQPVWQRNYYEHIIRSEHDLNGIRHYIENNPAQWLHDEENPLMVAKS